MASLTGDNSSTSSHNNLSLGLLLLIHNLRLLVSWLHHGLTRLLNVGLLNHRWSRLTVGLLHHLLLTWIGNNNYTWLLHSGVGWLWLTGNKRFVLDEWLLFVTTHFKL